MNKLIKKHCSDCGKEFTTKHKTRAYCEECYSKRQKEYREENKESLKEYGKDYYRENKESFKKRYKGNKGYYLYIVTDKENKVLYVGATENLQSRLSFHLNGYSNISRLMKTDKWDKIKYLDITDIVKNTEELHLLENVLIELYEPKYNKVKNIIKNMDKLRELSLLSEIHDLIQKWVIYTTRDEFNAKKHAKLAS